MKEILLKILLPTIFLFLTLQSVTLARDVDPCRLFPNGTKLRDPDDCSQAITCVNFQSVYGTTKCSGSTPFYDKDKDNCAKSLTDDSLCQINCTNSTGKFVADHKSCFGYYYCQDEELALYGHCPDSTHFNVSRQACVFAHESNCTVDTLNFCAIVKTGVNFNDESSCTKYFTCKKDVVTSAVCKDSYYDAFSGACVQKSLVDCSAHPLPGNVCGTAKSPIKNKFVSDGATCRGSFYCADVESGPDPNPSWVQCPENTFFNAADQSCTNPLNVVCTEDRCDGRSLNFVVSDSSGCRHYLRCANGVKVDEMTCGNNFFDEEKGICTSQIMTYPACYHK